MFLLVFSFVYVVHVKRKKGLGSHNVAYFYISWNLGHYARCNLWQAPFKAYSAIFNMCNKGNVTQRWKLLF